MPFQDARDTVLSAALAMILTRQQSLFHFHVFRQDFKNEISCPALRQSSPLPLKGRVQGEGSVPSRKSNFHASPQSSPLQRREADSLEPVAKWLARLNVLIHAEEITRI